MLYLLYLNLSGTLLGVPGFVSFFLGGCILDRVLFFKECLVRCGVLHRLPLTGKGVRRIWNPGERFGGERFKPRFVYQHIVGIYNIPRTQLASIFEGQPSKTRPFPIKTRVIWVPGINTSILRIGFSWNLAWNFTHSWHEDLNFTNGIQGWDLKTSPKLAPLVVMDMMVRYFCRTLE